MWRYHSPRILLCFSSHLILIFSNLVHVPQTWVPFSLISQQQLPPCLVKMQITRWELLNFAWSNSFPSLPVTKEEACLPPKVNSFTHARSPSLSPPEYPTQVFLSQCARAHLRLLDSSHACQTNVSLLWLRTLTVIAESVRQNIKGYWSSNLKYSSTYLKCAIPLI